MAEKKEATNTATATVEEAKKVLMAEDQKKREAFAKEYEELCEKYGFVISINPIQFVLVPKK